MPKNPKAPTSLTIHAYQVGFGDCFLLSFHYGVDTAKDRHILIDFGSNGPPAGIGATALFKRIAEDVRTVTNGKLHGVVLTHRHKDHIAGYAPEKKGNGSGDIIRELKPDVVVQPWTEDPDAQPDASHSTTVPSDHKAFAARLANMQLLSEGIALESRHLIDTEPLSGPLRWFLTGLAFLGEEGIKNDAAVRNLQKMGTHHDYVHHGSKSGLGGLLPGVDITVLGPPTIAQDEEVQKERSKDADEFWMFQALAASRMASSGSPLFPKAKTENLKNPPGYARWIIPRLRRIRAENLLQIVRIMDDALNNTSVILLFEINGTALLFPGDAQIENWEFALKSASLKKRLAKVNVYKVGHHGSRNATPRTLWNSFVNRGPVGKKKRLMTIVSTKSGKYGKLAENSEVPRRTLMTALRAESDFFTTQTLKGKTKIKKVFEIPL